MKFLNKTPIDDEMTVLDLLARDWADCTDRCISLWPHAPPHVQIMHLRDFGECPSDYILITFDVANLLKANGYLSGKPEWGYTENRQLYITELGRNKINSNEAKKNFQYGFNSLRWIEEWENYK